MKVRVACSSHGMKICSDAKAEDSGQITGHAVDSFFGVAYGEDLQPVTDAQGNYVFAFTLPNIQYMTKIN